ncbi:DUF4232 domain-containing protein [Terriglobus sp. RCC_193]|uniref:DUF4232 domain-containing protein n=1 Tax=Terriglobus sp. RCC_193 TaxID=3239218 RepID=UPI0035250E32
MKILIALMAPFLIASCAATPQRSSPAQGKITSACTPQQIQLTFDTADGEFNGMSHSGSYLVLTNTGTQACTTPRRPQITWFDTNGTVIHAEPDTPKGMHPGPVLTPVTLAPGTSARSALRWVSGEVYDHNTCANVARGTVKLDHGEVSAPLQSRMCGDTTVGLRFEEPWLQPQESPVHGDVTKP